MLGLSYRFGLADSVEADDAITETDGVRLVVDSMSLDLIDGSEVDFVEITRRLRVPRHQPQRRLGLRLRLKLLGLTRLTSQTSQGQRPKCEVKPPDPHRPPSPVKARGHAGRMSAL